MARNGNKTDRDALAEPPESIVRMRDALLAQAGKKPTPLEVIERIKTRKETADAVAPDPQAPISPWIEAIADAAEDLFRNANTSAHAVREAVVVVRWQEGYVEHSAARVYETPNRRRVALVLDEAADSAVRGLATPGR